MQAPKSPMRLLFEALKESPRLQGVQLLFGAREISKAGAFPRVVLYPLVGEMTDPEQHDNLCDCDAHLAAKCWGQDHDQLFELLSRLALAVWNFRLDSDINAQHGAVKWDDSPDASKSGEAAVMQITVRGPVEITGLTGGMGDVNDESFTRA
jgi:hypothetical protein